MSPNNILIRIGADDMYSVSNVSVHEEYDPSRPWENDIAIIELQKPVQFRLNVTPASLPYVHMEDSESVLLQGWAPLIAFNATILSKEECMDAVARLTGSSPLHQNNVCVGPISDGSDVCKS